MIDNINNKNKIARFSAIMKNYQLLLFLAAIASALTQDGCEITEPDSNVLDEYSINITQTPLNVIFQKDDNQLNVACQGKNQSVFNATSSEDLAIRITLSTNGSKYQVNVVSSNSSMTISVDLESPNLNSEDKPSDWRQTFIIILCGLIGISVSINAILCYYSFKQDASQVQQPPPEIPLKVDDDYCPLPKIHNNLNDSGDQHKMTEDPHGYIPMGDIKVPQKSEITYNQDLEDDEDCQEMNHPDQQPITNVPSGPKRKNFSLSGEYVQPTAVKVPVVAVMKSEGLITGNVTPEEARAMTCKNDKIDEYDYLNDIKTENKDLKSAEYTNLMGTTTENNSVYGEYANLKDISVQENLQNNDYSNLKDIKVPQSSVSFCQTETETDPVYSNLPNIKSKSSLKRGQLAFPNPNEL